MLSYRMPCKNMFSLHLCRCTSKLLQRSRILSTYNKNGYRVDDEKWFAEKLSSYETYKDPKPRKY